MRTNEALNKETQRVNKRCVFSTVLGFVADSTGIIGVHLMERAPVLSVIYLFFGKKFICIASIFLL